MGRKAMENVLVTVGTTQFDELIDNLLDPKTLTSLIGIGCKKLTIQYGNYKNINNLNLFKMMDFESELFGYKPSIEKHIDQADLIISHAGAGTVLEVLRKGKPLLIVINEQLMNNHQEELAVELAENQFVEYANISNLSEKLSSFDQANLKPFPKQNPQLFTDFISNLYQDIVK